MFILIFFSGPAVFLVKPVNQDVYTDNTTLINCKSSAHPSRVNRWYRNGIPVQYNSKYQLLSNNSLLIKSLNWEDNGKFQCAAENAAGLKFVDAEIKVLSKSEVFHVLAMYLFTHSL